MIVYRSAPRSVRTAPWFAAVQAEASSAARGAPTHDAVRDLLIEAGALEAAIADALNPDADAIPEPMPRLREASCHLGRALRMSWHAGGGVDVRAAIARAAAALGSVDAEPLPRVAQADVAEGYAYYALYPEGHLEAARRLARELRPRRAVCIGVRGIGTSLSAAAVAGLEMEGCVVRSYTMRPRGHPFARYVVLAPELEQELRRECDALFAIADEGPGLSGSSLACVADALSMLGIPDDRIVFLPSWLPDPDRLLSPLGRERWRRHHKFVTSFETLMSDSGRLARGHGAAGARMMNLSAGAWRQCWVDAPRDYPAVQPQHERRKYLLEPAGRPERGGDRGRLLKFVGLGRRGRSAYTRAQQLADAGFAPMPLGLAEGFLATEVVDGTPLRAADVTPPLLDRIAEYLALLRRDYRVGEACEPDALRELIDVNVGEGLGIDPAPVLARLRAASGASSDEPAVALDGRMLPHEWLSVSRGFLKTDGLEHHDDHFQPGPHDIAWDLAMTAEEFALTPAQLARLIERYVALTGDRSIRQRLPLHLLAYLAFRLGYSRLAREALSGSDEENRWRHLARRYELRLRRVLASACRAA